MAVSSATVGVGNGESESVESVVLRGSGEALEPSRRGCDSISASSSSPGRGLGGRASSSWKNWTSS